MRTLPGLTVVLALGLASGCSGGDTPSSPKDPAVSAFATGTCRDAAPGVLALRRAVRTLGKGPTVEPKKLQAVADAQQQVLPMSTNPDPAGQQVLFLFREAGFVRLQATGNSYDPKVGATLLAAADRLVTTCTAPTPSPS